MTTAELLAELDQEAEVTRSVLERVPEEKLSWKPHQKSMSLGQLAHHVANLPLGIAELVSELVREVPAVPAPEAKSVSELLSTFENSIAFARAKFSEWGDEGLAAIFRLTSGGATMIERPRGGVIRSLMMNHVYHHRGQLTVYLRLLDVSLPWVYGPTADEIRR